MLKFFSNYCLYILVFFLLLINHSHAEKVLKIEISGNDRIPPETIKMLSNINLGDDVSPRQINDLIKNLYETNFFKNIEINLDNNILKFYVEENPIISNIKINGIKAKRIQESINEVLSLREKSSFNEINLINEKEKIIKLLKSQGYIQAKIDVFKEVLKDNKINLIFNIDLGDKAKIKKITFIGNKIFKDQKLKRVIVSEEYKFWKVLSGKKYLNENIIKFDVQLLKNFYLNKGFYNVEINSSFAKKFDDESFELIFNINANQKVKFGKLELELPIDYDKSNFIKIKEEFDNLNGKFYSLNRIKDILDQIDLIVLNEQYETIKSDVEETLTGNILNLKFIISETEKKFVEKINIYGNNVTVETVIRNQLLIDEGDPYNEILKTKSINNIKSLNFFKNVNSEIIEGSSRDRKVINITVEEKPTGEITAGAGFGTTGSSFMVGVK